MSDTRDSSAAMVSPPFPATMVTPAARRSASSTNCWRDSAASRSVISAFSASNLDASSSLRLRFSVWALASSARCSAALAALRCRIYARVIANSGCVGERSRRSNYAHARVSQSNLELFY